MHGAGARGRLCPMTRKLGTVMAVVSLVLSLTTSAAAQNDRVLVLVVDPGSIRINIESLGHAIEGALSRPVVRMTDERAPRAAGRLSIAFSSPNRWVLRYEAEGQVAWVSDRITHPGSLRSRLVELSRSLVSQVETSEGAERHHSWSDDVILALQDEILDPFGDSPPAARPRPISVLWSEVVDPFREDPPRAQVREVWSEVLDPWAVEARRRR